jgi:hypothetical protein
MIEATGHMIDAKYDGTTLTVHGHNKAARIALAGADHDRDVSIPRDQIANVDWKGASMLKNGRLTVHTTDGRTVVLHFRKKQTDAFSPLRDALTAGEGA